MRRITSGTVVRLTSVRVIVQVTRWRMPSSPSSLDPVEVSEL
jgi:hypothetical protein